MWWYAIAVIAAAVSLLAPSSAGAQAAEQKCVFSFDRLPSFPWDYRRERWVNQADYDKKLEVVQTHHFSPATEALLSATKGGTIGADVAYTLDTFPNHYRALISLTRLGERERTDFPHDTRRTIDCWYQRAIAFVQDDTVVRGLYVDYLTRRGRTDAALFQLNQLVEYAGDSPFTHFNVSLLFIKLTRHEEGLRHAHRAAALGHPDISPLRELLAAAGRWSEPADVTPSTAPAGEDVTGK